MSYRSWFSGLSVAANVIATVSCLAFAMNVGGSDEVSQVEAVVATVASLVSTFFCLAASQSRSSFYAGLQMGANIACAATAVAAVMVDGEHVQAGLAFGAAVLSILAGIFGVFQINEDVRHDAYQILV